MFKLIALIAFSTVLQSCEDSSMRGVAHSSAGKSPAVTEVLKPDGGDATPEELTPGETSGNPVRADANVPTPGGVPTLIEAGPALPPSILAGATLTCTPNASNSKLRCDIRVNGKLVESKPKGIFIILGKEPAWQTMNFDTIQLGVYDATLPTALPASYMVAISLPDGKYVFDKVGDAALESENLVHDGSFEGLSATTRLMHVADVELIAGKWHIWSGSVDGCQGGKPGMQIFVNQNGNDASDGTRFIDLRAECEGSGIFGNAKIYQDISVRPKHFYQASFDTKKSMDAAAGNVMFRIDRVDAFSWSANSPVWAKSPFYHFVATGDTLGFELEEITPALSGRGAQIDNVKILDLGIPVQ